MAGQIFMRVDEVAEELGVSKPYAYKLIKLSLIHILCRSGNEISIFSGYEIPHLEKALDRSGGSGERIGFACYTGTDR